MRPKPPKTKKKIVKKQPTVKCAFGCNGPASTTIEGSPICRGCLNWLGGGYDNVGYTPPKGVKPLFG